MSDRTVYLITGAKSGIGSELWKQLMERPNADIVACVRRFDGSMERAWRDMKKANGDDTMHPLSFVAENGSRAVMCELDSTDPRGGEEVVRVVNASFGKVDVVIANAGAATDGFKTVSDTSDKAMVDDFTVNCVGPLRLFQACWPFMKTSAQPQFILISSSVGSLNVLDEECYPSLSYGASKAAANYLLRKIHFEHPEVTAVAIHPGWVNTKMGQALADSLDIKEPPMKLEESARAVLNQIDNATRSTVGGKFITHSAQGLPW